MQKVLNNASENVTLAGAQGYAVAPIAMVHVEKSSVSKHSAAVPKDRDIVKVSAGKEVSCDYR